MVEEVGWLCLCDHEGEGVWCTQVQTEPPGLSFALGMANNGVHGPGGS